MAGFEIPNEIERAVTESAERAEEEVRDNESWRYQAFERADVHCICSKVY